MYIVAMQSLLEQSKEIALVAIEKYKPSAVAVMFSGGNDSLTAYHVAKQLKLPLTHLVHGVTRTGISETTEFSRQIGQRSGLRYLEADAGDSFEEYVLRKGFYGIGVQAHVFAYHTLKAQPFRKVFSSIRKRRRNFKILLLNGARIEESNNRRNNFTSECNIDPGAKNNIWVNLLHHWRKEDCSNFLTDNSINRNPVTELLCRSGECLCGTMQSQEERKEAAFWFPKWGRWLYKLEEKVISKFPWGWGQKLPNSYRQELAGQTNLFQPACQSCIHKGSF